MSGLIFRKLLYEKKPSLLSKLSLEPSISFLLSAEAASCENERPHIPATQREVAGLLLILPLIFK